MTGFLERLLGRLPIGWLQLVHNRGRLAAALAGVSFANILVFMQLGFMGALIGSIRLPWLAMNADIIIAASDMNTLADGGPVPRQRMFEALSVEGVATAVPLYTGKIEWKQTDGTVRTLDLFGIDPASRTFRDARINARLSDITVSDVALIDRRTRNVPRGTMDAIDAGRSLVFEHKRRTITTVATFDIGGGFTADGYMVVSDQTFLKLFPQRAAGAPNYILVTVMPGVSPAVVARRLAEALPAYDVAPRLVADTIARETAFQTTQRPIGIVFGFGVFIGILVGIIIVYQVLATDVADHLKEYATFKAIGYPNRYFLGIVFEEAAILGILGFIPGFIVTLGLYAIVAAVTGLPVAMTPGRAALVFVGTVVLSAISGAIATRKLARANPADLF